LELKRFDEQIRAKKFDKETGKRLHAMQAGKVKNPLSVMDSTTFDAEGNPLISQRGKYFFFVSLLYTLLHILII